MILTSPVISPLLLLLLLAAAPLAPVQAASSSVSGSGSPTPSFSTSSSGSISYSNSVSISLSITVSISLSTSLSGSLSTSLSTSFSTSITTSLSGSLSFGASPYPKPVTSPGGIGSLGPHPTASATVGSNPNDLHILCQSGLKHPQLQCLYYLGGEIDECCTPACQFRKPDHVCTKKKVCYGAGRCGHKGVCDQPLHHDGTSCSTGGVSGACKNGTCIPNRRPNHRRHNPRKVRRLLERRLKQMRNQDLAARGLLPEEYDASKEDNEDFSAEEAYLADLNDDSDPRLV